MWLVAVAGLPGVLLAMRGAQGRVPLWLGFVGALLFMVAIAAAAVLGIKMHRQTLADRAMQSRRAMIVMIAAELGEQSDEQLESIQTQGGIHGEAAGMILQNRKATDDG